VNIHKLEGHEAVYGNEKYIQNVGLKLSRKWITGELYACNILDTFIKNGLREIC